MATTGLDTSLPTLLDHVKMLDPNGAIAKVVESLTKSSAILEDMVWKEGNLTTGHRVTTETALPSVGWRRLNEGISAGNPKTDQADEPCGLLEALSVLDTEVANLNGNSAAFRMSRNMRFLRALKNELETGIFYHSTKATPEKFMGLSGRFDLSTSTVNGKQIIKADSSASGSDQTSIWGIVWGPDSCYGIYPKGMKGGVEHEDLGKQLWTDAADSNKKFLAYVDNWKWRAGLCVEDYRQQVRVCNVDTSALVKNAATGADLIDSMIQAYYRIYDPRAGRLVWYCNRTVAAFLHRQARAGVASSTLSIDVIAGKPITSFLGAPIKVTDALTDSEAVVS